MKQQCKAEWIQFGDDDAKVFFAKVKQSTYTPCVIVLGMKVEGFDAVTVVMSKYYKGLLGRQMIQRSKDDIGVVQS